MKKFIKLSLLTIGAFLIMLSLGAVMFNAENPDDPQTTNSTSSQAESTNETSQTSSETQVEAKPNESRKNLEKAYGEMVAIEKELTDIKANNYQITVDQQRELAQRGDDVDVTSVYQEDTTSAGFDTIIKAGLNTQPVSGMTGAIVNLYDIVSGKSINGDAEDNYTENLAQFSRDLKELHKALEDNSNWKGNN